MPCEPRKAGFRSCYLRPSSQKAVTKPPISRVNSIVFLQEPSHTRFDLRFRLFGFPVRVHPLFWAVTALLAWQPGQDVAPRVLLIWMAAVFVSILIHELGHALAARYFGASAHIVLYSFGGLAITHPEPRYVWDRVAISFAGPAAGFLFALIIVVALAASGHAGQFLLHWIPIRFKPFTDANLNELIGQLLEINILWGLVNLLPIFPLDGGRISRNLFMRYDWNDGLRKSWLLSMGTAIGLAVYLLVQAGGQPSFKVFMLGYLAYLNYQEMNPMGPRNPW